MECLESVKLKEVSYVIFVQIYSKTVALCETVLKFQIKTVFYFNIFLNIIYSCDAKLNFQQSLLQSSASHDPSEIILI